MPQEEIIDSHIHLHPGRLGQKVRAFFDQHFNHAQLLYPLDHRAILSQMAEAGVSGAWTLPYAHKAGMASGLNEASAATVAEFAGGPVRLVGGATAHPLDSDPASVVAEALDLYGLRVLKLHCSVGNFELDDPAFDKMWDLVSQRRMPVVIHTGHHINGQIGAAELAPLERVAQAYPEARLIIAHCAHPDGEAALDVVEKYPQVYADLTPVVIDLVKVPKERLEKLAGKILFGSDAPNIALRVEDCIAHIRGFGLSEAQTAAILGGNARRLVSEVLV